MGTPARTNGHDPSSSTAMLKETLRHHRKAALNGQRLALYFAVPLLIAGVYGMNIPLPLQSSRWAFPLYLLVCVAWLAIVKRSMLAPALAAQA